VCIQMKKSNKVDMSIKMRSAVFGAGSTHLEGEEGNVTKAGSLPALAHRAEESK